MLKTIGKVLVILLVAGLLAAGIYALVENSSLASAGGFPGREFGEGRTRPGGFTQPNGGLTAQARPANGQFSNRSEGDFRGHGEGAFSLARGFVGMFGQLIQIAFITALVLLAQKAFSRRLSPAKAAS